MLRSKAAAVLNPASDCKSSLILGIGKAFRLMCLFSSQKSVQTRTSPVFLGRINVLYGNPIHYLSFSLRHRYDRVCRSPF
jgi:hypothetical protein